jgi:hypothetical protein
VTYASVDQLADALELRVTPDNTQLLQDCLEAAESEINGVLVDADTATQAAIAAGDVPAIVVRTEVNRAVEWFKAPATYNGGVGYSEIGAMASPTTGFERHALVLQPLRAAWGIA